MALTESGIVKNIQSKTDLTKKRAFEIVETLSEIIKKSLESGDDVMISGFGKFCFKEKDERKGRNPATGEAMMLKSRRVATFRCSRNLRERINGG